MNTLKNYQYSQQLLAWNPGWAGTKMTIYGIDAVLYLFEF